MPYIASHSAKELLDIKIKNNKVKNILIYTPPNKILYNKLFNLKVFKSMGCIGSLHNDPS